MRKLGLQSMVCACRSNFKLRGSSNQILPQASPWSNPYSSISSTIGRTSSASNRTEQYRRWRLSPIVGYAALPARFSSPWFSRCGADCAQGNLLRLPWSTYESAYIRLRQSNGGGRVAMPAGAPLRDLLDITERRGPLIRPTRSAAMDTGRLSYVLGEGL